MESKKKPGCFWRKQAKEKALRIAAAKNPSMGQSMQRYIASFVQSNAVMRPDAEHASCNGNSGQGNRDGGDVNKDDGNVDGNDVVVDNMLAMDSTNGGKSVDVGINTINSCVIGSTPKKHSCTVDEPDAPPAKKYKLTEKEIEEHLDTFNDEETSYKMDDDCRRTQRNNDDEERDGNDSGDSDVDEGNNDDGDDDDDVGDDDDDDGDDDDYDDGDDDDDSSDDNDDEIDDDVDDNNEKGSNCIEPSLNMGLRTKQSHITAFVGNITRDDTLVETDSAESEDDHLQMAANNYHYFQPVSA